MAGGKLLVYLLRRDLRVSDNPILHHLATSKDHGYTHLLPVFVFPSHQVEVSGFLKDGEQSPYPPAVSEVGKFWRCGPHRAKFLAQSVWDMKKTLEGLENGLAIRVGSSKDVVQSIISHFKDQGPSVEGVWMTEEKSYEEKKEEDSIASLCSASGVDFQLWPDEKYFVDDRDNGLKKPSDLHDVFTSYRKSQEPLRERPRQPLAKPQKGQLPVLPQLPPQQHPFVEVTSYDDMEKRLLQPLGEPLPNGPSYPKEAVSAHPFEGGETNALDRLQYLIKSGGMTAYTDTRNGLVGADFSTKLSAYLALGCVSARQIHKELVDFEDGTNSSYEQGQGYGKGENAGTRGVRFELLWRDYMRLCTEKFGQKLFRLSGFRQDQAYEKKWKTGRAEKASDGQDPSPEEVRETIQRFIEGSTGMGLIDASQRELLHTGYTSNRARQNVASFLSKHMGIDWRYGAEWYEMLLVDYDVSSNWSNWQYVAGVGNDPRGDARIFNPVKQAFDYDKNGDYVRMWVPEVKSLEKMENVFQPCTASKEDLEEAGIADHIMVTHPIKKIDFTVDRKPKGPRKPFNRRRGQGRGGRRGGGNGGNGGVGGTNGSNGAPNGVQQNGAGGHGPSDNGSRYQQNGHTAPHVSGNNGNYRNAGYGRGNQSFPPSNTNNYVQHHQQQFGDTQWFNNGWSVNGARGYNNGGYRGRGGGVGGGIRGGYGRHFDGYAPPPHQYYIPQMHHGA